ncbi:uncharacterized protein [Salminus brasiliensis]|uniref:uncharacterized protein n=1 Tax=Salminus brasiliensis TaxID=930266 RepID=UPI003B82D696
MEHVGFLCLLLCGHLLLVSSGESLCVRVKENRRATIPCGKLTKGKVTWSRDINGERVDILTTHNGELTKHITDPDRRYSSGADIVLIIFKALQSDAGRYYCNGTTVELTLNETCKSISKTTTTTTSIKPIETSTNTSMEGFSGGTTPVLWTALIIAGGCVVAVFLILLTWRCFFKRKAHIIKQDQEVIYDTVNDVSPARTSASNIEPTQWKVYDFINTAGAQPVLSTPVYMNI